MSTTQPPKTPTKPADAAGKKKPFYAHGRKPEEVKGGIPMLKYGKGNNFYKFKEALSVESIEKFGNLGRLIKEEKYYVPVFTPVVMPPGTDPEEQKLIKAENVKLYTKEVGIMALDRPKLYGMIRKHMSVESVDEVSQQPGYDKWSEGLDPEKLWQAIVLTHKIDTVSNVPEVTNLTARKAYQGLRQGAFEPLAQYSERFRDVLKTFVATGTIADPVEIPDTEQAMDFFHGLDPARYGAFKVEMLNGRNLKAFIHLIWQMSCINSQEAGSK